MANGEGDLETVAKLEGLEDEQEEGQGPTMMGRHARQLMLSGQGDAGLQAFKARLCCMFACNTFYRAEAPRPC